MKTARVLIAATTFVAAIALAGCADTDFPRPQPSNTAATVDVTDQPGSVEGYVGALDDAAITLCAVEDGVLRVEGTVTNPVAEPQDYRIYVSALVGTETTGLVQVDITDVSDGATQPWATQIESVADGAECVLRVERFATQ
ncbi:hypothetical protein [Humidisolicoccus flavus]|uniref:hypothetical protein n=1 Tax=Humidisolicoccus flavus TaxID=3111414 RepID=UPI00324705AA